MHSFRQRVVDALFVGLLGFAFWNGRAPSAAKANAFGFSLEEVSKQSGLDFVHRSARFDAQIDNIMPSVAGVGAAVSAVDVDGDGWTDLYATSSAAGAPNALFVNQHDGTFRERAAEAGLADLNRDLEGVSMGSVWADYDNDGDADVFVYKYGRPQLFANAGGLRFEDVTQRAGVGRWMNSNGACWLDYDRDGLLDLYVAGYFREDIDLWKLATTRIMHESFEFAQNGGHNYLYRNLGDGRFEDVTARLGVDSTRWTLAVASADFDQDGWADLYLANDYGPEELFLNRGGERFERAVDAGLDESSKSGMAVALGDFTNEARVGTYVTNISKSHYLFQGNNLRLNRMADRGRMHNLAEGVVADCGWAWGAQFGDLNNDGRMDLYVVNGFISDSRERDYWFGMNKIAIGAGDLSADALNWPPMEDRSLSGYERSRVLMNQGRSHFSDAANVVGATDLLDGRAVVLADFSNRGVLDVVIANQKGPLLFYRNTVAPARHWIQFDLQGTQSNRDAIGAHVTVVFGALRTAQVICAGSGFASQNEKRLHFGLGDATTVDQVIVRWPSGAEQVLRGLAVDRLHAIVEAGS